MTAGYFFVNRRGADDISGIIIPDIGNRNSPLRKGAELRSISMQHGCTRTRSISCRTFRRSRRRFWSVGSINTLE
jgi:hypothetical protein